MRVYTGSGDARTLNQYTAQQMQITSSPAIRPQQLDSAALQRQARRLSQAEAAPWLHSEVAQRMAERLPVIKLQPRRLLQWSAFLGGSEAALKAVYPDAEQVRVEPTSELAERSLAAAKRGWLQTMLRRTPSQVLTPSALSDTPKVDLVWANMGLHADADIPRTLAQWHDALAVDGFLMFSCFGPDSFIELKKIYAAQGWGRPSTEWWDMHDIGDLLIEAGFADPVMDQDRISLTWGDAESLLKDLHALGGNLAPERFGGCRGKAWRASLLEALEGLRGNDGRLRLSLELVYGHAFKAAPKLQLNAETHVSLEQMRSMVRQAGKP